jgi:type I restriction enzyme M protein
MFTTSTIKAIQDIMRQDIGVDGDATRLSQMVWLIFLKILDDEDRALEIRKDKFVPTLPKKYQWRSWAGPFDGMTGDKLIEFVNNDLLPGLRNLPESNNKRTELTRTAFNDVYNFMRKGTLLKQVINKINEIDFNASKDRHTFNEIYERLLKSLQSAGNFGEMYTPRAVTQFIVEMVDPKIGESVLDPAVGTGGFLVHSLEHMRKQVKSVKDEHKIQESIYGVEKKPLPFMLLITNMMLHGIEEPMTMRRGNTLEKPIRDYTDADKVNCIVTNPPFGGTEEPGIESNFPKEFQTRETADLFLVLIMRLLKNRGRAGVVLPDTFLFGTGMKTALKKHLLEECNLHTIIRLPKSVFAPYTNITTNLLFFTKGEPTKEVWYFEHPFPEGQKTYSMTTPIRSEDFDLERRWWNKRKENDYAWRVSIEEIERNNYDLDFKNPRAPRKIPRTILTDLQEYWNQKEYAGYIGVKLRKSLESVFNTPETSSTKDEAKLAVQYIEDLIRIPEGVKHLEDSILALAASGNLVPQNPREGNANHLYEQIQKIQEKKGNSRKKKHQHLSSNQKDLAEIPPNWRWLKIMDVFDLQTGATPSRQVPSYFGGDIPWLVSGDIKKGEITECDGRITESGFKNSNCKIIPPNSVLIALNGQGKTRGRLLFCESQRP